MVEIILSGQRRGLKLGDVFRYLMTMMSWGYSFDRLDLGMVWRGR